MELKPAGSLSPVGPLLRPVLFNIVINVLDEGIKYTFSKFLDNTTIDRNTYPLKIWKGLERDMDRLDQWVTFSCMAFNKGKCCVMRLGHNNSVLWFRPGEEWLKGPVSVG